MNNPEQAEGAVRGYDNRYPSPERRRRSIDPLPTVELLRSSRQGEACRIPEPTK
jgi:hypothetical protein